MLLVAYREQRLLVRPSLDAGEELRELVSGGQERFLCCARRLPFVRDVKPKRAGPAAGEAGKNLTNQMLAFTLQNFPLVESKDPEWN